MLNSFMVQASADPGPFADLTSPAQAASAAFASGTDGTNPAANAFDNSTSTFWQSNTTAGTSIGHRIGWDFGAGNEKSVARMSCRWTSVFYIQDFAVEYSDNGTSWTQAASFAPTTANTDTQYFAWTAPGPHRYWSYISVGENATGGGGIARVAEIEFSL